LENQTFDDDSFDLVIHLDVMEHLYNPFTALREVWRTLRSQGDCIFTVPIEPGRQQSQQVAFLDNGNRVVLGDPE
jgi:2-polyprenyl-3-methyl-5-hydroxy-6-metoxy-1,4-benzoquinol methylase